MSIEDRINQALNHSKDGIYLKSMPPADTDIDIVLIDALAEIKDLKQQLKATHESRIDWVNHGRSLEA